MPKIVPQKELLAVLEIIRVSPEGISVGELCERLDTPRRTLQRRLERLIEEGKIIPSGEGRGRRYHVRLELPVADSCVPALQTEDPYKTHWSVLMEKPSEFERDPTDSSIRLSTSGIKMRELITRPLDTRAAVSYRPDFLLSYQPNETEYLSKNIRENLAEKGVGSGENLPAGTYLRKVMNQLLIDLSWNSSRLEGNTFSLLETERLLESGEDDTGKSIRERLMILNHKTAIEILAEQSDELGFNRYTIMNLHAALSEGLLDDEDAEGRLRNVSVGIGGTKFRPLNVPAQIEEYFDIFLKKAEAIKDPFEQSFFAMVHLPYLQPFEDVNKRTSRLAANVPLVKHNLSPLSFIRVPQMDYINAQLAVYEFNSVHYLRDVYVWAYEKSCAHYAAVCQKVGAPDPLRFQYRSHIKNCTISVVLEGMDKQTAATWISQEAQKHIPSHDRARFCEAVEDSLRKLHEGSIARHRIRPEQYHTWKMTWR